MPKSPEGPRPVILRPEKIYRDRDGGVSLTRSHTPGVISHVPDNSDPHEHLKTATDKGIRARLVRMGANAHRILLHKESTNNPQSKPESEDDPA